MKYFNEIKSLHTTEIFGFTRGQIPEHILREVGSKIWKRVKAERDKTSFRIIEATAFPFNS